ncbi:hypothetical protein A1D25_05000 [Ursidibacter arcticus]|nr:hypothetical protein A1D25_05000 [Ursidibacter arcticus]
MSNLDKSPELAGLWAGISQQDKPELSVLMYQRAHLDIQLNRLRVALVAHQEPQPTAQVQFFGLPSVLAEVMLKPALSVLQNELQRQDCRLNPHQQERNQYPMSLGFVAENWYLVVATLEASDSLKSALKPLCLGDFGSYSFLKAFLGL